MPVGHNAAVAGTLQLTLGVLTRDPAKTSSAVEEEVRDGVATSHDYVDVTPRNVSTAGAVGAAFVQLETPVAQVERFAAQIPPSADLVLRFGGAVAEVVERDKAAQDALVEALLSGDWVIEPDGPSKYRPERRTVLRKVGLIHEDHYYDVILRNLSKSGARITGLAGVPVGTDVVLDLGHGQLVVSKVVNASENSQGLKFETQLISDGGGGFMTRHRISPYSLAEAGIPLAALGYLSPVVAGAAMALSSVSVMTNALLLKRWRP